MFAWHPFEIFSERDPSFKFVDKFVYKPIILFTYKKEKPMFTSREKIEVLAQVSIPVILNNSNLHVHSNFSITEPL